MRWMQKVHFSTTPRGLRGDFGNSPGGNVGIFVAARFPIEFTRVVRAGHLAIAAADAPVVVHDDQAVVAMVGSFDRAHLDARGILAVQAGAAEVERLPAGGLFFNHDIPGFIDSHIVGGGAGAQAVLAANAPIQVDHHPPLVFTGVVGAQLGNLASQLLFLERAEGRERTSGDQWRYDGRPRRGACDGEHIATGQV